MYNNKILPTRKGMEHGTMSVNLCEHKIMNRYVLLRKQ